MKAIKWINAAAFAAMVIINALANLLPIGGNTTGQVSQAYPNLFTPAPFTFSVWGLIYLLMLVFVIFQLGVIDGGTQSTRVREQIGPWFTISCALNILWIFFWHYRAIGLSTVCIALLLIVLNMILRRLKKANATFAAVNIGFSLYFGWIIAATIANISVWLTMLGWNGWGLSADFWTFLVLLIGTAIAAAVVLIGKTPIAALGIMWAYAGILVRHLSPAYLAGAHPLVITAGFCSEVIILIVLLLPMFKKRCAHQAARS